tara:strand:+ start:1321 stop:1497 length:177 start_codon:yes stop_codon:yes gene_type:complete
MNQYKQIAIDINTNIHLVYVKPIIYFYPTKSQKANIKIIPNGEFTFNYPKYPNNGWSV